MSDIIDADHRKRRLDVEIIAENLKRFAWTKRKAPETKQTGIVNSLEWFYATDGIHYNAAFGELEFIDIAQLVGFKTRGGHNWLVRISGDIVIPGSQVQSISFCGLPKVENNKIWKAASLCKPPG